MVLARMSWADRVWALPCPDRARSLGTVLPEPRSSAPIVAGSGAADGAGWCGDGCRPLVPRSNGSMPCVRGRVSSHACAWMPRSMRRPHRGSPSRHGRPRKKGRRLPTLAHLVTDPTTRWQLVTVAPWYGQKARRVHITSATAVWYHSGLPPVPIRWVLIRDPAGKFAPQALLSTTLERDPVQILTWFIQRWQLETTCEEARAHLGLETPRQWNDRSVNRTTPAVFGLYSIVTRAAAHLIGDQPAPVRTTAWYPKRGRPSPMRSHW